MVRTYRPKRPKPLPTAVDRLLPAFAVDLTDRAQLAPFRLGRPPTVVCSAESSPRVLLGVQALAQARRLQTPTVDAWHVPCDEAEAYVIARADRLDASQAQTVEAVALLRAKGVPSVAVAAALGLRPWAISRFAAAHGTGERLATALARGVLPLAHTRLLAKMTPAAQTEWTERAIAGKWSFRRLDREIREATSPSAKAASPDMGAFVGQLRDRLGTEVRLEWPENAAQRRLILDWYGPEDLKGLLAKLAAGPETTAGASIRRELVLNLTSMDELDALTGHLLEQ